MLIKEYRITLPITVEDYQVTQVFIKVCQVDYVHLEADLGYIYSYKNL